MPQKLMLNDLSRSGLNKTDAKTLKLKPLTKVQSQTLIKIKREGYVIPYFDIKGKKTSFYRVRFTDSPKGFNKTKKPIRYTQPVNQIPRFYLAPFLDWEHIAKDKEVPIYITEGEKKSAKACKEGFTTIGLGGVWNWKSKKQKKSLIDDFKDFSWRGREVILVFDSDYQTNPKVYQALLSLCKELTKLGAIPSIVSLPSNGDEKIGFDDFLVNQGAAKFENIEPEEFLAAEALWKFNERFALVHKPHVIYDFDHDQVVSFNNFSMVAANHRHDAEVVDKKGDIKFTEVSTAKLWKEWKFRREHTKLTYLPGLPTITDENELNEWKECPIEPVKSTRNTKGVKLYLKLRDHLFAGEPEHRDWFDKWIAYPLQNPGAKLYSAVIFHGLGQGTGKTLMGATIGRLYGDNFSKITHGDLLDEYTDWAVNKQFILGEEISGTDKRTESDRLKDLVTGEDIRVKIKYIPGYSIPNCINFLFTSNHFDAFYLDLDDRRYFIINVISERISAEFAKEYDTWFRSDQIGELLYYFKNVVNVNNFNPQAAPPITKAKAEMIYQSMSITEIFASDLWKGAEDVFKKIGIEMNRDLYTSEDLLEVFKISQNQDSSIRGVNSKALGKALLKVGFAQRQLSGPSRRYYIMRNVSDWINAPAKALHKHYDSCAVGETKPKLSVVKNNRKKY